MVHIANIVRKFGPIALVLVIIFAVFFPALSVGFFADDFDFAVRMPQTPFLETITRSTDGTHGGGSWRPITMMFFWLTLGFEQSATFNHLVSLVLYLVLLGIVYACVRELFSERSVWFASVVVLLVGVMPIHAEPVVWIAARGDLLAAVGGFAALYAWLRGYAWWAIAFLLLSLGAKEFWLLFALPLFFLAPTQISHRKRLQYFAAYLVGAVVWFVLRFYITRYGFGGYSITPAQNIFGVQHLANEIISFVVGSWSFGSFQSWIVRFSQHYWFIVSWVVAAIILTLGYFSRKHPRARFLFAALVSVQLPVLALTVPFIQPGAMVGEQRYWFAGSIFFILLAAHFVRKHEKLLGLAVGLVFFLGITSNIDTYVRAASYRDSVLLGWKTLGLSQPSTTKVAFLPDSWYGVHLLASPFFEAALEKEGMPKPRSVSTWYQQCTAHCLTPASIQKGLHGLVRLFAQDPRIFSQTSHGLRYDATEQLEPGTTLAVWSGTTWIEIFPETGENCLH